MCECDDEPDEAPAPLTEALIARMRTLERSLDGEHAPEEDWEVFLGRAAGSIPYATFTKLARCRQGVLNVEQHSRRFNTSLRRRRSFAAQPVA